MNLDWIFPWRRPRTEQRPFKHVAAMAALREASERHTEASRDASTRAMHGIDRQVAHGMIQRVFERAAAIQSLTNEVVDRTMK